MLTRLIGEIRLPAFICDDYTNVLAGNNLAMDLLDISEAMIESAPQFASGFNLLRVVFAPESAFRQLMADAWLRQAQASLHFFRAATLRYRHTDRFRAILANLSAYRSFRESWFATPEYSEDFTCPGLCTAIVILHWARAASSPTSVLPPQTWAPFI